MRHRIKGYSLYASCLDQYFFICWPNTLSLYLVFGFLFYFILLKSFVNIPLDYDLSTLVNVQMFMELGSCAYLWENTMIKALRFLIVATVT